MRWAFSSEYLGVMTLQRQKSKDSLFFFFSPKCSVDILHQNNSNSQFPRGNNAIPAMIVFPEPHYAVEQPAELSKSKPAKLSQVCTFFGMVSTLPLRLLFLPGRTHAQVPQLLLFQEHLSCTKKKM